METLKGSSGRRTRIPDRPNKPISLWSIVKNFVGKEMTKVAMPVNFSEPLSMLQRLTEDFDYSELLDKAANVNDDLQMAYVAAFAISSYSTTTVRTNKPFNPLLGETYECDRMSDLGWRCISEQVSHHPPVSAMHCEGKEWTAWQDFTMSSKFRGKYLRISPHGVFHLVFNKSKNHFTWNKVCTIVHNLILGNLWVDHTGTMEMKNHKTGWQCIVEFVPYSFYNKDEQRCIRGTIQDYNGEVKWIISGRWDHELLAKKVLSIDGSKEKPIFNTGPPILLWKPRLLNPEAKKYYNFTLLACQLNEPEPNVAPTDSRNRPDQRLMEEGDWNEANMMKVALEEKQREKRNQSTCEKPLWFSLQADPLSGLQIHIYNGKYWDCKKKQNWSKCPDIFTINKLQYSISKYYK